MTVTIKLTTPDGNDHRQHLEPGEAKPIIPGLDAHHLGDELLVTCGDLDNPVERVEWDRLDVEREDKDVDPAPPVTDKDGVLEYGQGWLYRLTPLKLAPPEGCFAFLQSYLADGPPITTPPTWVEDYLSHWGPWPDPNVTSSTGSGRLRLTVPAAIACLLALHHGIPERADAGLVQGQRWVARQWLRGCHFYRLVDGKAAWWRHQDNPEWMCHQGYGKTKGGWSTLYSSKRPPGVTWVSSGDANCDPQHLAVDQSALFAALTGSKAAAIDALCAVEAAMSLFVHAYDPTGRSYGHMLRGLAVTYAACKGIGIPCDHLIAYAERVVAGLEARNLHVQRGSWPCIDSGNYNDGGHLEEKHLEYLRPWLEPLGWTPKEAARSGNVWQAGIIAHGCAAALRYMSPEASLRKRLWPQMELAAAFIIFQGTAPAWDASGGYYRTPLPGRLWDDVAPGQLPGKQDLPVMFGWKESDADGVGIRFVASGLLAYAQEAKSIKSDELSEGIANEIVEAAGKNKLDMRYWAMETWRGVGQWPV